MSTSFDGMISKVKECGQKTVSVAVAQDSAVLEAVRAAKDRGIANAILVGDEAKIKAIAEECTVVLSTHILSEVQATCNYIRMIGQGTLVFSGTVDEFDNYILPNTVFATLVAAPPIEELKQLPGVVDVDELGGSNYRLRFSDSPQEMIERVVQTSVAKDWRLTEVRLEKSSLDDIFAELSKIKK